jgi:hypothetical protein
MIRMTVIEGPRPRMAPIHELTNVEFAALCLVAREFGAEVPTPSIAGPVRMSGADCAAAVEAITPIDSDALDYHIDRRMPGEAANELRDRWRTFETALMAGARGDGLELTLD